MKFQLIVLLLAIMIAAVSVNAAIIDGCKTRTDEALCDGCCQRAGYEGGRVENDRVTTLKPPFFKRVLRCHCNGKKHSKNAIAPE